jgi:hypothetical protein
MSIVDLLTLLIGAQGVRLLLEYGAGEPANRSRLERKSTTILTAPFEKRGVEESHAESTNTYIRTNRNRSGKSD